MTNPRALRILMTSAQVLIGLGVAALLWPATLGGAVDYVMVSGVSMQPGMQDGDLVLVRDTDDYEPGDVIAYRIPEGEVGEGAIVIHRIVDTDAANRFTTQGDSHDHIDTWHPRATDVVGERWVRVPAVGQAVARLRNPLALGVLAGGFAFLMILVPTKRSSALPA